MLNNIELNPYLSIKYPIKGSESKVVGTGSLLGDYLRSLIFLTEDVERPEADLTDLSQFGITNAGNKTSFFIPTSVGQIGAWYLEPVRKFYSVFFYSLSSSS